MKGFITNITKNLMPVAKGIAGGAGSRVVTSKVAPMIPFIKDHPKLHPLPAILVGTAMMSNKSMSDIGFGMAVVAGTDMAGNFVPMIKSENIGDAVDGLADELADLLEQRLNDDVSNAQHALNDDVSNAQHALNDELNDDLSDDLNDDLSGSDDY